MVIIHAGRLPALLPFFFFLSPVNTTSLRPLPSSQQCGGGVKVTQLYSVKVKQSSTQGGDLLKGGGGEREKPFYRPTEDLNPNLHNLKGETA